MMDITSLARIVLRLKKKREKAKRRKLLCRTSPVELAENAGKRTQCKKRWKVLEKVEMIGWPTLKCEYPTNIKAFMTAKLH